MKFLLALAITGSLYAETAFLQSTDSNGVYTYCLYESTNGEFMITLKGNQICPLTIEL
jgi:hypothetical protein